jgi:hypothetical protein
LVSWFGHIIPDRWLMIPGFGLASIIGDSTQYPRHRLLEVRGGVSAFPPNYQIDSSRDGAVSLATLSLKTKLRLFPVFDDNLPPDPKTGIARHLRVELFAGLGAWAGVKDFGLALGGMPGQLDGGASASLIVTTYQRDNAELAGEETFSPVFIIDVNNRFERMSQWETWRIDFYLPLTPWGEGAARW